MRRNLLEKCRVHTLLRLPTGIWYSPGVKANVIKMKLDGTLYMYAEAGGLVVIAHETKPTRNLQERVLLALRYLYIRKPKAGLYTAATAAARKKLSGG